MPLATRLRLAPHQLGEIRKSTGKLISKETMPMTPALPSESWGVSCSLGRRLHLMSRCASSGCFPRGWEGRRGCQPLGRGCSCSWVSPRQAPATFRRCDSRACCLKHPLPARRSSPGVRICTSTMHVPEEILELKGQDEKVQQEFHLGHPGFPSLSSANRPAEVCGTWRQQSPSGTAGPASPRLPGDISLGDADSSASPRKPGGACQGSALQKKEWRAPWQPFSVLQGTESLRD